MEQNFDELNKDKDNENKDVILTNSNTPSLFSHFVFSIEFYTSFDISQNCLLSSNVSTIFNSDSMKFSVFYTNNFRFTETTSKHI